jgi:hypothetical protein
MRAVPQEIRPSFRLGFKNPKEAFKEKGIQPDELKCMQIGYILGMSHAIQKMCEPNARITPYSTNIGWELGER